MYSFVSTNTYCSKSNYHRSSIQCNFEGCCAGFNDENLLFIAFPLQKKSMSLYTWPLCRLVTTQSRSRTLEQWPPWSECGALQDKTRKDVNIGPVVDWVSSGIKHEGNIAASSGPETWHYLQFWDALVLQKGILTRKCEKKDGWGVFHQFILPECIKKDVLFQMHNCLWSEHLGRKKTKEKLLQRYYWYQTREDVNLLNKFPVHKPRAPLGNMPLGYPLDRLSTDFLGP